MADLGHIFFGPPAAIPGWLARLLIARPRLVLTAPDVVPERRGQTPVSFRSRAAGGAILVHAPLSRNRPAWSSSRPADGTVLEVADAFLLGAMGAAKDL